MSKTIEHVSDNNLDVLIATQNCYDRLADYYWSNTRPELREHYLSLFSSIPLGSTILDAGCGTGHDALQLVRMGYSLVAVDLSSAMCQLARQRLVDISNVEVIETDSSHLNFASGTFAGVLSALELFHHPKLRETIEEYSRVLASPGKMVIVTNHPVRNMLLRSSANYFSEDFFWEDWGLLGRIPKFHWSLHTYLTAVKEAGLQLDFVHEIAPSDDIREVQDSSISFQGSYPSFLILECSK